MVEMQGFIILTVEQIRELLAEVDQATADAYNEGHEHGHEEGINEGFNEGVADGYDEGYDDGFGDGREAGYSEAQFRAAEDAALS